MESPQKSRYNPGLGAAAAIFGVLLSAVTHEWFAAEAPWLQTLIRAILAALLAGGFFLIANRLLRRNP